MKTQQYRSTFPVAPMQESKKTSVVLCDSDGTIFPGNIKEVISLVIRYLKTSLVGRQSVKQFMTQLSKSVPAETKEKLEVWLQQQEEHEVVLPFEKSATEFTEIHQIITSFFPLIEYKGSDTTKTYTALDTFTAIWEKGGTLMLLTFNIYAPSTIRTTLIARGLPKEKADELLIICPPSDLADQKEKIYFCEPPGDGESMNKNKYIEKALQICEKLKLLNYELIFIDDQHTKMAQKKWPHIKIVTGDYLAGEHWKNTIAILNGESTAMAKKSEEEAYTSSFSQTDGSASLTPVLDTQSFDLGSFTFDDSIRSQSSTGSFTLSLPPTVTTDTQATLSARSAITRSTSSTFSSQSNFFKPITPVEPKLIDCVGSFSAPAASSGIGEMTVNKTVNHENILTRLRKKDLDTTPDKIEKHSLERYIKPEFKPPATSFIPKVGEPVSSRTSSDASSVDGEDVVYYGSFQSSFPKENKLASDSQSSTPCLGAIPLSLPRLSPMDSSLSDINAPMKKNDLTLHSQPSIFYFPVSTESSSTSWTALRYFSAFQKQKEKLPTTLEPGAPKKSFSKHSFPRSYSADFVSVTHESIFSIKAKALKTIPRSTSFTQGDENQICSRL